MGKKKLIALAEAIRMNNNNRNRDRFSLPQVEVLADFCKAQNPKFKRERWIGYIFGQNGPNGGKK